MKKTLMHPIAVMTTIMSLMSCLVAHGNYFTTITNDNPICYFRLDEPNTGTGMTATNYGSLGAAGNAIYHSIIVSNCPGALAGDPDTSCGFIGTQSSATGEVYTPYLPAFNSPRFSFEAWVAPIATNTSGGYWCAVNERGTSPADQGFILYAEGNPADWQFWMGTAGGWSTVATTSNGGAVTTNWQYVVGTYDGTNQTLYVNGTVVKVVAKTYVPNTYGGLQIGAGGETNLPSYGFETNIDEVAVYTNALTPAQIISHYAAATGSNPPEAYAPNIQLFSPNQTNYLGATVIVSVNAGGSLPFAYQWSFSSNSTAIGVATPIPGATNSTYVISNLALTNQGGYWVTITNLAGSYTSATDAWVQVVNIQSPTINTNPESEIIYTGGTAHFTVGVSGGSAYTYQWQSNSVNIAGSAGGTNAELVITNVQPSDAGNYLVMVGDPAGTNPSTPATLSVLPAPGTNTYAGIVMSDQPVSYWRMGTVDATNTGGSIAYDLAGGFNGAYYGPVEESQPGAITNDSDYSTTFGAGSTYVDVPFVTNINSQAFSVELWANDNGQASTYYRAPLAEHNPSTFGGYNFYGTPGNIWAFWLGNGASWTTLSGPAVQTNVWTHLAATYDGTTATFYVNGVAVSSTHISNYTPNAADDMLIGSGGGGGVEEYFWTGGLNDLAIYNTALSASRIAAHYNAGAGNTPPVISLQPFGGSVLVGSNITLTASANGTAPLSYQWQQSGVSLSGQTNASLPIIDVTWTEPVSYDVIISNMVGSVTSSVVYVTGVTIGSSYSNLVIADGAVGYWPLDEASGSTADNYGSSGSVDDGNYENGVTLGVPGPLTTSSNTGAEFTANNDTEVNMPYDSLLNGNEFTVDAWAQMTGPGQSADEGYQGVYSCRDYNVEGGFTIYGLYGGDWIVYSGNGSVVSGTDSGVPVQVGQWAHLALTYDGITERFYVNGTEAFSNTTGYVPNQIDMLQERIGAGDTESSPGAYFFEGNIADVAVYDTCLPAASIQAHYTIGSTTPVVASPSISISQSGGNVILTWSGGSLQQSTNLYNGSWSVVTNAVSPWNLGTTSSPAFFRVMQ